MKKLEIKTRKGNREPKYTQNIDSATVFLRHQEDRIEVKNEIIDKGRQLNEISTN